MCARGLEAFHFLGERPPPCLLIHGFTGTPYETRALGEHLHARGHTVLGVRLAGHGDSLAALERTGWEDWYRDVVRGCRQLVGEGGPVVAIGMSAGALLALHLAHERPDDVQGLALMAVAISLSDWRVRWALPLVARVPWLRDRFRFMPKAAGSDIHDSDARRVHPSYRSVPLTGALSLLALQRRVRRELPAITHPTLLIHGALDRTCPPENIGLVARSLGRPPRRTILLPNSAHVVTVDHERDQVMSAVGEFVADLDSAAGERR